jgi:uncharacterized OB-fold protein
VSYPPRLVCPQCRGRDFDPVTLSRDGKVLTVTTVRVPPAGFTEQTPLPIALIELDDGVQIMAQIGDVEDPTTIEIGMPIRLEFRRICWDGEAGVIFYGHKAVPGG